MPHINGAILTEDGFVEGHISFENGVITGIDETLPPYPLMSGIVVPPFFNAHTHLGDSFIKRVPAGTIEDIVGPGGYKHRMLESAPDETMIEGMRKSMKTMISTGTLGFADFREGGIKGVELLKKAVNGLPIKPAILSRPVEGTDEEIDALLEISDGFGMSSISDHDFEFLRMLSEKAHKNGKIFAIHFSERIREDIGKLLDLKPDFIVHAIETTGEDMDAIAEARIPVVICPRSNCFFGKTPKFCELLEHGIEVHLGTDNGMLAEPDMLEELRFLHATAGKGRNTILREMVMTLFERKLLKGDAIGLKEGQNATFTVIKKPWKCPEKGILNAEKEDLQIFLRGSDTNG